MATKKKELNFDEQVDILQKRADAYEKIRTLMKTFPEYNNLVIINVGQAIKDNEVVLSLKYVIPYKVKDTTWCYRDYNYHTGDDIFTALPLSWVRENVKKYKTAIEFKMSYNFNKGNFGFKFVAVMDASDIKNHYYTDIYGNHHFAQQKETPQDILNAVAGWKSSAAEKTSVRRKTNDTEFFKSAITMMVEAIKSDDIGKAKIAAHNMQTSKTISLLA